MFDCSESHCLSVATAWHPMQVVIYQHLLHREKYVCCYDTNKHVKVMSPILTCQIIDMPL